MSKRDYYEILGVHRGANAREVKSAYRRMAMKFHPDHNPGDPKAEFYFKEVVEAYEVLSDEEKRILYDQFGHEALEPSSMGGPGGFGPGVDEFFKDIFGDFFGAGAGNGHGAHGGRSGGEGGSGGQTRGRTLRADLELSFEEAIRGTEKILTIRHHASCTSCGGDGAAPGTTPKRCAACGGRGQVHHSQGFFTLTSTCAECHGSGQIVSEPCPECGGNGDVMEERHVVVKVPPGVDDGMLLRLRGEGSPGEGGGPPGDLRVVLHVQPSDRFERDGFDLHFRAKLDFVRAALGCALEIPTLDAPRTIEVAPGTQYGDRLRLDDCGVPEVQGQGRGDLYVHFVVQTPTSLDDEQRELLQRFAALRDQASLSSGHQARTHNVSATANSHHPRNGVTPAAASEEPHEGDHPESEGLAASASSTNTVN